MATQRMITPEIIRRALRTHTRVYKAQPWQQRFHVARRQYRFRVVNGGRRLGKDLACIFEAFYVCILYHESVAIVLGPTNEQQRDIFEQAQLWLPPSLYTVNRVHKEIRFHPPCNSVIAFRSAQADEPLRGAGERLKIVIFDEAAYIDPQVWVNARPAMMDNQAWGVFISTPNRKQPRNWFYDLFIRGQRELKAPCPECGGAGIVEERPCEVCKGKGTVPVPNPDYDPRWISWQYCSYENTPERGGYLPKEEIDQCITDLGLATQEDIRREIYAEFVEGTGEFLTYEEIKAVVNPYRPLVLEPNPEHHYVIAVDPARSRDYTAIVVMDQDHRVCYIQTMKGLWATIKQRVRVVWERYNRGTVVVDTTREENFKQDLIVDLGIKPVIGVNFSVTGLKYQMLTALQAAILEKDIELPNHREAITQLCNLVVKPTPGGRSKIEAGSSRGHDDIPDALAMAYSYTVRLGRKTQVGISVTVI